MNVRHWLVYRIYMLGAIFALGMAVFLLASIPAHAAAPLPVKLPATGDCYRDNIYYGSVLPGANEGPVLVFVHGYSGLASDWWVNVPELLVNEAYDRAYEAGYRTAFVDLSFDPDTCRPRREPGHDMMANGFTLARQIEAIREHYVADEVDIIAYSKGGIDAQAAIVFWGAWQYVRNVFTVGTPHQGSILADLLWSSDSLWFANLLGSRDGGSFSLQTSFMKFFRQTTDPRSVDDHIDYYTGAGKGWDGPGSPYEFSGAWLQDQPAGGDNDGIVTVASTELAGAESLFLEPWHHKEMMLGQNIFPYIHNILLQEPPPSAGLVIFGATSGYSDQSLQFTARAPVTSTSPISFVWTATGQTQITTTGGISTSVTMQWDMPGTKMITVTAVADNLALTTVHSVEISNLVAPADLTVSGPVLVHTNTGHTFQADLPMNTSLPVTYTWQATDHTKRMNVGDVSDIAVFLWDQPGTKMITVTATNQAGTTTTTRAVQVESGAPPAKVALSGLTEGIAGQPYRFTVNLPEGVETPIIYTWEATDQPGILKTGTNSDSILFTWRKTGEKIVTVTAANSAGQVQARQTISIAPDPTGADVETLFIPYLNRVPWVVPHASAAGLHQGEGQDDYVSASESNFILRGGYAAEAAQESVVIEPEAKTIEFTLLTSVPDVTVALVGPDGSSHTLTPVPGDFPDLLRNAYILQHHVDSPAPGYWDVQITSPKPAGYMLLVYLDSSLHVELHGLPEESILAPEQTIELSAYSHSSLAAPGGSGFPAVAADHIRASVSSVGMENQDVKVIENEAAGSTIIVSELEPDRFHTLTVTVQGETDGGHGFERTFVRSLAVPAQGPDSILEFLDAFSE